MLNKRKIKEKITIKHKIKNVLIYYKR